MDRLYPRYIVVLCIMCEFYVWTNYECMFCLDTIFGSTTILYLNVSLFLVDDYPAKARDSNGPAGQSQPVSTDLKPHTKATHNDVHQVVSSALVLSYLD